MAGRLEGKIVIVTGGSRGTGEAITRRFVAEGARVAIADIREREGHFLSEELGQQAIFVATDVSDESQWGHLLEVVNQSFGEVEVLVNNAALLDITPIDQVTPERLKQLYEVNQLGPILGIQAVLADMRKLGFGSIINIGSTDGVVAQDIGLMAYGSTKFALRGITKIAAMELGREAIRVNCINPDSGNIEMSRPFLPTDIDGDQAMLEHIEQILKPPPWQTGFPRFDEIAAMALFLASDESSGCTGGEFPVDGGYTAGRRFT